MNKKLQVRDIVESVRLFHGHGHGMLVHGMFVVGADTDDAAQADPAGLPYREAGSVPPRPAPLTKLAATLVRRPWAEEVDSGGVARARAPCDTGMTAGAGTGPEPVVIDGGDRSCVSLLLELREHIARHRPGTVVHLIATDPAAPLDLAAWCHLTGHRYLGAAGDSPDSRPVYVLQVSGSPRRTHAASPWRLA